MENAVHLVGEGHFAHAAQHEDDHAPEGDEHGCNSVFHACACHAPVSFVVNRVQSMAPALPTVAPPSSLQRAEAPAADGVTRGLFRPPIR